MVDWHTVMYTYNVNYIFFACAVRALYVFSFIIIIDIL